MKCCMSIGGIFSDCIATSFAVYGLGCSNSGNRENTGGDLVSCRLAGADKMIGVILLVKIVAVVRPTTGVGVKTLGGSGKKLGEPT